MPVALRPPIRLCFLRVRFAAGVWFPSVVRVVRLFLWLNDLDPGFGDNFAIELLDPFELSVEIFVDCDGISNLYRLDHNLPI